MKSILSCFFQVTLLTLAAVGSVSGQQAPRVLADGVEITADNERTALVRSTARLDSTVDVTLRNTGERLIEPPFHAVITFTPEEGSTLDELTATGLSGGIGVAPYQTYYMDLSNAIGTGLGIGQETTFTLSFQRPSGVRVSYGVVAHGIRNRDPVASVGGPYAGQQEMGISFDGSGSSDPDGDALEFHWDFGDGNTATGATLEHVYQSPGLFTATLTVSDNRGGSASRETQVPVVPPGVFALGRSRTLDGNGHPLGRVSIMQTGPDGTRSFGSDATSGFASLGGQPGDHIWHFSQDGYLTNFRKATLVAGSVRVIPYPWLAALNPQRTTLSVLNDTDVVTPENRVALTVPAEAFGQIESVALTDLHSQSLPLPLPHGWSPVAAFHFAAPDEAEEDIGGNVALPPALSLALVRFDETEVRWETESVHTDHAGGLLNFAIRNPGSYAVVVADSLPSGNPAAAVPGEPLPAGEAPVTSPDVTAIGKVNPERTVASIDPERVTTLATVDFTNAAQPLASGAWFSAEVSESYDLLGGQSLKTPDYDATFYAYQSPGDADPATASAAFPLRPRILFGPDELIEARIQVNVLAQGIFSGGILTPDGAQLTLAGLRIGVPAGLVSGPSAAEIRMISTAGLERFSGGIEPVMAFALDLPPLDAGAILDFLITRKLAPDSHFVLARLITTGGESGLEPILRLKSDASGTVTSAEPATGPRLPGISGSGQYVVLPVEQTLALIIGTAANEGGTPATGATIRVVGEPWLSVTNVGGNFFSLGLPGERVVLGTDPATGNIGEATATLADAAAHAVVNLLLEPSGPRIVATSPADGAVLVLASSPISIQFNKAIDPASFGLDAIRLRDLAADADVPASLSLDLGNRRASLLPINPLSLDTEHEIVVSSALRDSQNLPIEGDLIFTFKTRPSDARVAGAQLVIYEPDAENIPEEILSRLVGYNPAAALSIVVAHGSPGTADPEVPVILVNENSGETATVLSRPDGSFASFINAAEDDFISAVFVNTNDTRITIPATRQLFDDGSVGLYRQGGILEAESDGGPVRVLIEPEAISTREKFRISPVDFTELVALVRDTLPEGATMLGGFRFEVDSEEALGEAAKVSFPLNPDSLGLEPGENPEDRAFALTEAIEIDGEIFYNVIDQMRPIDGELVTTSPPFIGLGGFVTRSVLIVPVMLSFGNQAVLTGRVGQFPDDLPAPTQNQILQGSASGVPIRPVEGALVSAYPDGIGLGAGPALRPGSIVSRTNSRGFYSLMFSFSAFDTSVVLAEATTFRFPNQRARQTAIIPSPIAGDAPIAIANIVFRTPSGAGADDTFPPTITVRPPGAVLPVGEGVEVDFIVRDDRSLPSISRQVFIAEASSALVAGETLAFTDLGITRREARTDASRQVTVPMTFFAHKAMSAVVEVTAVDASGNERTGRFQLRFGTAPAPVPQDLKPSDPKDVEGPRVILTIPGEGGMLSDGIFDVFFNEPIRKLGEEPRDYVTIFPDVPFTLELSPNQRQLRIHPRLLESGKEYFITLNPTRIVDLSGNMLENPRPLVFRTPAAPSERLEGTDQTVASAADGVYTYNLQRGDRRELVIHKTGVSEATEPLGRLNLPPFPRAVALIPQYRYRTEPSGPVRTSTLLAVTGGVLGEGSVGPWFWIVDVTDPENPFRLASRNLTLDFATTVSSMRWSAPYVVLNVMTPEGSIFAYVNLQALILGNHGFTATTYDPGLDLDGDGEFVSPGERLPVPLFNSVYGLETSLPIAGGRMANDFDVYGRGTTLVAALPARGPDNPSRIQVFLFGGDFIGSGTDDFGAFTAADTSFFRVRFSPAFPVIDESGPRLLPVALATSGSRLFLLDLTDPVNPREIREVDFGEFTGALRGIELTGSGEVVLIGTGGTTWLRTSDLGDLRNDETSLREIVAANRGGGRSFGGTERSFVTSSGGIATQTARPPTIRVGQIPGQAVISAADLKVASEETRKAYLDGFEDTPFITPWVPTCDELVDPAPTTPFDPATAIHHHYLRVHASGHLGETILLSGEALDASGNLIPPVGGELPPTLLTRVASSIADDKLLRDSRTITARRLSDDPRSPFYNEFISSPIVVVAAYPKESQWEKVAEITERQVLHGGHFLRFGLDVDSGAHTDIQANMARLADSRLRPGIAVTAPSLPLEYRESPNRSQPFMAPRLGPIDLQSGEVGMLETDMSIEGRGAPLEFARYYASRAEFSGPLGRNWDFNFNARIIDLPSVELPPGFRYPVGFEDGDCFEAVPGDVLLIDGLGGVHRFKVIRESRGNMDMLPHYAGDPAIEDFVEPDGADSVQRFFESPKKFFSILVQAEDGRFLLVDQGGNRTYFHPDGRLDSFVRSHAASRQVVHYREDGLIDRVMGDRGIAIEFGYYFAFNDPRRRGADIVPSNSRDLGRIARIRSSSITAYDGVVEFQYDADGNLHQARPADGPPKVYTYDSDKPKKLRRAGLDDGTVSPAVEVAYDGAGFATSLKFGSRSYSFSGAAANGRARALSGGGSVQVTGPAGTASMEVDTGGHLKAFGGKTYDVDSQGRLKSMKSSSDFKRKVYDKDNPVYRFRGNVVRFERGPDEDNLFISEFTHDGSTYNREVQAMDVNGVVTETAYTGDPAGGETGRVLTNGPFSASHSFNPFGQITEETRSITGATNYKRDFLYGSGSLSPNGGLQTGETFRGEFSLSRDSSGRIREVSEGGAEFRLDYTSRRRPEAKISLGGEYPSLRYTYDDKGRVHSETVERMGQSTRATYIYHPIHEGRRASVLKEETGLPATLTSYSYSPEGRLTSVTMAGEVTTDTLDMAGRVVRRVGPGISRETDYNDAGRIERLLDNGHETTLDYDDVGRLSEIESEFTRISFTYDGGAGLGLSDRIQSREVRSLEGNTPLFGETYTYNGGGLVETVTSLNGRVRSFEYFPDRTERSMSIDNVVMRERERDQRGRLIRSRMLDGVADYGGFDAASGLPQTATFSFVGMPAQMTTGRTYDGAGRVLTSETPMGTRTIAYDGFGRPSRTEDADGVAAEFVRSPSGIALSNTFADGTSATTTVSPQGRVVQVSSANGAVTKTYEDGMLRAMSYPDGVEQEVLDRNAYFRPTIVREGGTMKTYTYEGAHLVSILAGTELKSYERDALGRVVEIDYKGDVLTYEYDDRGELAAEEGWAGQWRIVRDSLNRTLSETYPSGLQLDYSPNSFGRPVGGIGGTEVQTMEWFGPGMPARVAYSGGIEVKREYDGDWRMTSVRYERGGETIAGFVYGLSSGGRVLSEGRLHDGTFDTFTRSVPGSAMRIVDFRFDAEDAEGTNSGPAVTGLTFERSELRGLGARTTDDPAVDDPRGFFVAPTWGTGVRPTEIDGLATNFNTKGAMTRFPVWARLPNETGLTRVDATAGYYSFGSLEKITRSDGVVCKVKYDGAGRIIKRVVSVDSEKPDRGRPLKLGYAWRDNQLIETYKVSDDADPVLLRRYVWMGALLAEVHVFDGDTYEIFIPIVSLNGSIGGYLDMEGNLVETILYGPYGYPVFLDAEGQPQERSSIAQDMLFQGQLFCEASGVYFMGYRTLHPLVGIFLQREPEKGLFQESIALFTAFMGDPAGRVDPTGLTSSSNSIPTMFEATEYLSRIPPEADPWIGFSLDILSKRGTPGVKGTVKMANFLLAARLTDDDRALYASGYDGPPVNIVRAVGEGLDTVPIFAPGAALFGVLDYTLRRAHMTGKVDTNLIDAKGAATTAVPVDAVGKSVLGEVSGILPHLRGLDAILSPTSSRTRIDGLHELGNSATSLAERSMRSAINESDPDRANFDHTVAVLNQFITHANAINDGFVKKKIATNLGAFAYVPGVSSGVALYSTSLDISIEGAMLAQKILTDPAVVEFFTQLGQWSRDGGFLTTFAGAAATFNWEYLADKLYQYHQTPSFKDQLINVVELEFQRVERMQSYLDGLAAP